jgi:hypothetical protein
MEEGTEVSCNGFDYMLLGINQCQDEGMFLRVVTILVEKKLYPTEIIASRL